MPTTVTNDAPLKLLQLLAVSSFGGAQRHVLDLCAALPRAGHEAHLCCRPRSWLQQRAAAEGIPLCPLPLAKWTLGSRARLDALQRRHGFDLMHAHSGWATKAAVHVSRRRGVPVVVTMHDDFVYPELSEAARVIAISRHVVEVAVAAGIPPERVSLVRNGVDTDAFRRDPEGGRRVRAELGLAPGTPLVGIVGRMTRIKGHDVLLRALARIPGVHLAVVGVQRNSWCDTVCRLARDLGVWERVHLLPVREDVCAVLSALDALAQPSRQEACGLAALEAMACECPVVASCVGGLPEILGTPDAGILVPPEDPEALANALSEALSSPERGPACRAHVANHFPLARMVAETVAVYQEALGREW